MNLFVKGLFVFLLLMATYFTAMSTDSGIVTWLRFLVLYNNIIPLSLKVGMDVGKMFMGFSIGKDAQLSKI